jgi:hypothetical protein
MLEIQKRLNPALLCLLSRCSQEKDEMLDYTIIFFGGEVGQERRRTSSEKVDSGGRLYHNNVLVFGAII